MPQASLSRVAKATGNDCITSIQCQKLLALSHTMESFREPTFASALTHTHARNGKCAYGEYGKVRCLAYRGDYCCVYAVALFEIILKTILIVRNIVY